MVFSILAFWGVGFIGGWSLAFVAGMQGMGIWIGLAGSAFVYSLFIGLRLHWYVFNNRKPVNLAFANS